MQVYEMRYFVARPCNQPLLSLTLNRQRHRDSPFYGSQSLVWS
jgi:hypothetical protein